MHSKKHLSVSALLESISNKFGLISDNRAPNSTHKIKDVMLSGLACMYFQSQSLLEFQRKMQNHHQKNNLKSMFNVNDLPTDNSDSKYELEPLHHNALKKRIS